MALVLFSAMRNEGPYLFDWIAYHKAIGFDRICIVTNDCDDGSNELLGALADNGVIDHFDQEVPKGVSPQRAAVRLMNKAGYLDEGDWGLFLDADEYLNIHVGEGRVSDLIQYLEDRNLSGMLINWRVFGDAGQKKFGGSYVSHDFTRSEVKPVETQFKTFFKTGAVAAGFSAELHRCRLHPGAGQLTDFIDGSGRPLGSNGPGQTRRRHIRWLAKGEDAYSVLRGAEIGYDIAQINHYLVRDPSSFALKVKRGRGHVPAAGKNTRHTAAFYRAQNRNDAEDTTILRWVDAVAAQKEHLIATGDVQGPLTLINDQYEANIKAIKPMDVSRPVPKNVSDFPLTFPNNTARVVKEAYENAGAIIEYGSGGSTILATGLGKRCLSVESDAGWASSLRQKLQADYPDQNTTEILHVDVGPTKEWGFPKDNQAASRFWQYPTTVWDHDLAETVDTVLIDGRMRKACFAAALLNIKQETRVLFDDYQHRRIYHQVEQFAKPVRMVGRMAEFVVKPGLISAADFRAIIPWFADMS